MTLEEITGTYLEKPEKASELEALKEWYSDFLFSYAKTARIENKGSITPNDNKALDNHDFALAKEIVQDRHDRYQKEITTGNTVENALLTTAHQRTLAKTALEPILNGLVFILKHC